METHEHSLLTEEHTVVRTGTSVAEYLAFENASEERHEFHNGEIIIVPGNTSYHERLVFKILRAFGNQLPDSDYSVFSSNLKTMIPTYNRFVYPDITIVRGQDKYRDEGKRELLNPTVIIEILSPSTAKYDVTDKFEYYRSIPSLEEIAFFEAERPFGQLFRKNIEGRWNEIISEDGVFTFTSLQASISLAEIYPQAR